MKLTDFALIFVVILLPIVIIVYVNTSFVIRAEREEMYYKNVITSAVTDATNAMKTVENDDYEIDYGYSGIIDNKISVNADVAINTFFTSLYNNMGIKGNSVSEESLKAYIPVISIIDYDGIYIYSAEKTSDDNTTYLLKPKVYFAYTYYIEKDTHNIIEFNAEEYIPTSNKINGNLIYQINFTQDDYIFLTVYQIKDGKVNEITTRYTKGFYLEDDLNNTWLIGTSTDLASFGGSILSTEIPQIKADIVTLLKGKRREVIAKTCMKEISYAVNAHNIHAKKAGIKYNFTFNIESDESWYETVDGIGMLAVIQGISLGNRHLNYTAYSMSELTNAKRYYLSDKMQKLKDEYEKYNELAKFKYYHASNTCPIYQAYLDYIGILDIDHISPSFLYNKEEAASNGFKSCFICKP